VTKAALAVSTVGAEAARVDYEECLACQ